jgi:hypothetical protein
MERTFKNLLEDSRPSLLIPGIICFLVINGVVFLQIRATLSKMKKFKPVAILTNRESNLGMKKLKNHGLTEKLQFSSLGMAIRMLQRDKKNTCYIIATCLLTIYMVYFALACMSNIDLMKENNYYWIGFDKHDVSMSAIKEDEFEEQCQRIAKDDDTKRLIRNNMEVRITIKYQKGSANAIVYETYEDSKWVNYKVTYTLGENDAIILDYANKEKVEGQYTYVSVNELHELETSKNAKVELEQSKNELDTANAKIEELNGEIKSLNEKVVEKSNNAKVDTDKFNELTDKLVSLNSLVAEMQPIVEKYNAEVFEKSFNEAKESYKVKFTSVNALDVFEEDSTQELIKESINQNKEKANEAIFNLNSLIVNSIKPVDEKVDTDDILSSTPKISINQVVKAEDTENLTNVDENVLSEYGFNY